jgi:argininosuccinate lyase
VLVAHFLLAHIEALRRDWERLDGARREADRMPLGSGAIAGTNYAVDVDVLARRLGFERTVRNSIDASADRDFVSTFLHAGALVMVHLSRVAEDFVLLTRWS